MNSPKDPRWKSVFLSYNHRDRQLATALYQYLVSIGVQVWFDQVDCDPQLDSGELSQILYKEILKHDLVLLIVSENSLFKSYWVEQETNILGFEYEEEESRRRLLLITFSGEVPDHDRIEHALKNTELKRFERFDLISVDNIEHASEWGLQYYLRTDTSWA